MKKPSFFLLCCLIIASSCKKEITGPTIYIEGANPYILNLGTTFLDPGARAIDAEKSDASANIKTIAYIDANRLGDYYVTYTAKDKYRNPSVNRPTRKIQVTLNTQALVGYYQFTQTTNVNPTAASNFDFISFTTDTAFTFFNFSNIDSVYVNAHLSGAHNELITIPVQTITRKGKNYEVSGSGKAMPDAKTLQINFIQKELDIINPIIQTGVTTYHRVYF